ncbi:PIN/TRAM domain-containing protein [Phycisphaera mikurensis]|uniref:TRAM domain-containing protein n=1 Tax=Phycisphaera mikurensis (strain NBRC 102666 / KCTC 22515 / FYK2301M01) TaxID=1142394 RepID=I0IE15_PHYMF|nr:PIN domain-containing protein [Phycisphaera mikurensis]MBB6441310.1 uncharacterized protein YacL [Phycisphaera mikurensis]BAM03503.1 hypothetical protein PSMK_13440 [Phycisphaera mikurensis NBRC 102666]
MILYVLRGAFLILVAAVITLYANSEFQQLAGLTFIGVSSIIAGVVAVAAGVIALDVWIREKRLSAISGVFLGLLAGLLAAYALSFVVDLIGVYGAPESGPRREAFFDLLQGLKVVIGLVTCYIAMSLVLQTKDDFRFVIPYVEFAKEIRGSRPTLLDTSVIVDGRVLDIADTKVMQGAIVVPRFVLDELQKISDASDKLKRARGRRGLDRLQKLRDHPDLEVRIDDTPDREAADAGVDARLIAAARRMRGRLMTNDFNLAKVAKLRGVDVINLNDLARALRPVLLPGEQVQVRPVKLGEGAGQGVGYLEDGTMVVVDGGRDRLHELVEATVTSALQTSAGRMIFATLHEGPGVGDSMAGLPRPGTKKKPPPDPGDSTPGAQPPRGRDGSRPSRRNPRR